MIAEALPTATKILFGLVAIGLVAPALYNVFKATPVRDRHYDRNRYRHNKPVDVKRYRNLWVVDREDTDDDQ